MIGAIVELWSPAINFVELQEDAWSGLVVGEVVFLDTRTPGADVHVTYFPSWWGKLEIAIMDVWSRTSFFVVSFIR